MRDPTDKAVAATVVPQAVTMLMNSESDGENRQSMSAPTGRQSHVMQLVDSREKRNRPDSPMDDDMTDSHP